MRLDFLYNPIGLHLLFFLCNSRKKILKAGGSAPLSVVLLWGRGKFGHSNLLPAYHQGQYAGISSSLRRRPPPPPAARSSSTTTATTTVLRFRPPGKPLRRSPSPREAIEKVPMKTLYQFFTPVEKKPKPAVITVRRRYQSSPCSCCQYLCCCLLCCCHLCCHLICCTCC